jgi:hypothetical protein
VTDRTPIRIPPAPKDWRMNPDQVSRVAQDPRLHRLSHDELYHFFNQQQSAPGHTNVLLDYANRAANYVGLPHDWLAQAFSWHPANTIGRTANALTEVNDRMGR